MSADEQLLGHIRPYGNSSLELRVLRSDDGRVRLTLRDDDLPDRETRVVELAAGDRVEITSTLFGTRGCFGEETKLVLVRHDARTTLGWFCFDTQWGGVLHSDVVGALRDACDAVGAIRVEQKIEKVIAPTPKS
jgi:hypothetical protein